MPKSISWKKLVRNFRKLGFGGHYSGGRHLFMVKNTLKIHIPNKYQGDVGAGLVYEILRQADISKKHWDSL